MGTARTSSKYGPGTVGWVIGQYRQSPAFRDLSPRTQHTYLLGLDKLHAMGQLPIDGLRRHHILRIRDQLSDTPGAANTVVTVLGALCRFALDRGHIDTNPCASIKRLRVGEWQRWTPEQLQHFHDHAREPVRRAMVLALYTGQRRADLCKMLWSDVTPAGIKVTQQKTGRRLLLPILPALAAELDQWRRVATAVTVLTNADGRPWQPVTLTQAFQQESRRLGMPGVQLHGLRKTFAALLAEAGCGALQIGSLTGHKSLQLISHYTKEADQVKLAKVAMNALAETPILTARK